MTHPDSARGLSDKSARADDSVARAAAQAPDAETGGPDGLAVRLAELEQVVEAGLATFVAVGEALREIRDKRLYRERYATFEVYCRERWGWDRRNANRHVQAAEIAKTLGSIDPISGARIPGVQNVGQARAIAPLYKEYPEKAAEVMRDLLSKHGEEDLTAAKIAQAVAAACGGAENPTDGTTAGKVRGTEPTQPGRPEAFVFRGGDLPVEPDMVAEAIGDGKAVALAVDASAASGFQKAVREAKRFVEAAAQAARGAEQDAHLLVVASPDLGRREMAERALLRPRPKRKPPRDSVTAALSHLALARRSSVAPPGDSIHATGTTVARDGDRLLLRRAGLRLSVPVSEDVVAGLEEPLLVADIEQQYRSAAAGGKVLFSTSASGKLVIEGGARRYELNAYHAEEARLGAWAEGAEEAVFYEAGALRRAVDRVLPYASKGETGETRDILQTIFFDARGGGTRLAATDSFRLAWDDSLTAAPFSGCVPVPTVDLKILSRLLGQADPGARVGLSRGGDSRDFLVVFGELAGGTAYEIVSRPAPGYVPEYQKHIPDERELARFGLDVGEALEAVEAAAPLAGKSQAPPWERPPKAVAHPLRVEFDPEQSSATMSISGDLGAFSTTLGVRCSPAPDGGYPAVRAFGVNPHYLAETLETLRADGKDTAWIGVNQSPGKETGYSRRPVMLGADVLLTPMRVPLKSG